MQPISVTKPSAEAVSELGVKTWPVWTCEPSKFDWDYTQSETCLVLEGEVTVSDRPEGDVSVSFGPGDLVVFPVGLKCIWDVKGAVKKHYNFS